MEVAYVGDRRIVAGRPARMRDGYLVPVRPERVQDDQFDRGPTLEGKLNAEENVSSIRCGGPLSGRLA